MMILVIGRPDSGKSEKAEEIAMELSDADRRIYLATMVPYGEEGSRRVERHKALREGKGFVTVERERDVSAIVDVAGNIKGVATAELIEGVDEASPVNGIDAVGRIEDVKASEATVLLECMANLCANVMFGGEGSLADDAKTGQGAMPDGVVTRRCALLKVDDAKTVSVALEDKDEEEAMTGCGTLPEERTITTVLTDIRALQRQVKHLIVVTNEFTTEGISDPETLAYIRAMSGINRALSRAADKVYDITGGSWKIYENH